MYEQYFTNIYLFRKINNLAGKNETLDSFFIFCSEYLFYLMIIFFVIYFLVKIYSDGKAELKEFFIFFTSSILAYFVTLSIKHSLVAGRPPEELDSVNLLIKYSIGDAYDTFPSGHTTIAFALFTSIALYNKALGFVFLIIASLIAFARVYTGVHYPFDVLAGMLIGMLVTLFFNRFFKKRLM
ncbi:hypothetical protein CSB11_00100 [Candidatus Campbellbacteria bacterium]|nr:MAG: hypothetical protein CSB11_00100 [Candidatus Campbellbacteria bacterium]